VFLKDREGRETDQGPLYLSANRGKKSITVDIATPQGQAIIRRLAAKSDVLVENFRVGTLKRYGLDYDALFEVNPGLVYCSITGFGQSGPYAARPGYDAVFQAMCGLMSVTGASDAEPGGGPMKVGPSIIDVTTGLYAALAVVSALYRRDRNGGGGQSIDLALFDAGLAMLTHDAMHYLVSGTPPGRRGTEGNGGMPTRLFRCRDGHVMISVGNDEQFGRLCAAIDRPAMSADARFVTNALRRTNRRALIDELGVVLAQWKTSDLVEALNAVAVPAGPANRIDQVFADPQIVHRGMKVEVPHPLAGSIALVASPIRLSDSEVGAYSAPPLLGEHTEAVLTGLLGMAEEEVERLRRQAVI
jgi:crotonobetainyl-CoA:carnitine CoA-transferase CaiB-like acyl-CoA transferase